MDAIAHACTHATSLPLALGDLRQDPRALLIAPQNVAAPCNLSVPNGDAAVYWFSLVAVPFTVSQASRSVQDPFTIEDYGIDHVDIKAHDCIKRHGACHCHGKRPILSQPHRMLGQVRRAAVCTDTGDTGSANLTTGRH